MPFEVISRTCVSFEYCAKHGEPQRKSSKELGHHPSMVIVVIQKHTSTE